ncbi:MAG: HNH endonuclease family protein, partial [Planctomycetota bacterium]
FMDIVGELDTRHVKGKEVEVLIRKELVAASASNEFFLEKLTGPVYEENVNATRFILCSLAEEGMTKETWVDLWTMDGKHFVWTIEHILPQGEKLPKDWVMMIADGDKELAADYQASYVHTLGNLTLSGFNSSLSNKSFEDKRDRTDRKGRFVGYKNNLNLNRELAKADRWTVKQIQARTQCLAEDAMKLFALDR